MVNKLYAQYVGDWKSLRTMTSYEYMGHIVSIRLQDSVWEFLFAHDKNVISLFFKKDKSGDRHKRIRPYEEKELANALNFVKAHANAAVETVIKQRKVGQLKLLLNKLINKLWHNQAIV